MNFRIVAGAVAASAAIAGCGSDGGSASSTAGTSTAAAGGKVTVKATDFAFAPKAISAHPGKLTITMADDGAVQHELVVLKTSRAADALPVKGARVSEAGSVGEVPETSPGASKSATIDLKPGSYVYVCNIPGHYRQGMRGTLTVG